MIDQFEKGKQLKEYATFGIGGQAKYFIAIDSTEKMQEVIRYCYQSNLSYLVLGKGSNILFDDKGYDGLVILNKINYCKIEGNLVDVGAGYSFSLLGVQTARKGLSGLEFASGIPGSVGGAVFMNAGANKMETFTTLISVGFVTEEGQLVSLKKEELTFGYRHTAFHERKGAIVSVLFELTPSVSARSEQLKIIDYRLATQPYKDRSAGCVFRNPEKGSAGALIEQCGLKGFKIGGAEVSLMHANFIVNRNEAKAEDVLLLAKHIKRVVKEKTGVELEFELRTLGDEKELI